MENKEKTPEQKAAEKLRKAQSMGDAISHFSMKLGVVSNETPIEEQIKYLSNYNDVPSVEEIKSNEKKMDSYRQEFMNTLYDNYFKDFPEMLERLGDKKTDNNMANFYALRLMAFLFSSGEEDGAKRKENIEAYYRILPQYQSFFINYIVNNERWELTVNEKDAFIAYSKVYNEHKAILAKYPNTATEICLIIKEVRNNLFDKILHLKDIGLDEETYNMTVTNFIIGKYLTLKAIFNKMAEGGVNVLGLFGNLTFKEYSLNNVYESAAEVQDKFSLNEEQKKQMSEVMNMLTFLKKQGVDPSSSSSSGCMLTLLLLLIPLSLLACIL
jgi:hypothetical protein